MSVVSSDPLPEAISTCRVYFWAVGEQPAVDVQSVAAVRSCCDSCLCYGCQRCILAAASIISHVSTRGRSIFGKYVNMYLKYMVYGRKHGRIHTHLHNPVPLVWGSLRLAPIK